MQDSLHMIRATLKARPWLLLWLFNTTNLINNFECVLQQLRIPFNKITKLTFNIIFLNYHCLYSLSELLSASNQAY